MPEQIPSENRLTCITGTADSCNEKVQKITNPCIAKFNRVSRVILENEGGFSNRKGDKGKATNKGIAWATWKAYAKKDLNIEPTLDNLKQLSDEDAETIYRKRYWEPKGFCKFKDDHVALMVYDWTITSGGAIREIQNMLNQKFAKGLAADGVMGSGTIGAINDIEDQEALLDSIAELRKNYYEKLTLADPRQKVNLKGWLNRVNKVLNMEF